MRSQEIRKVRRRPQKKEVRRKIAKENLIDDINSQKTVKDAENYKRSQKFVKNCRLTRKYRRKIANDCRRPRKDRRRNQLNQLKYFVKTAC